MNGLTGELKFNKTTGTRSVYEVGIYETTWHKPLYKVGTFSKNDTDGNMKKSIANNGNHALNNILKTNNKLIVISIKVSFGTQKCCERTVDFYTSL